MLRNLELACCLIYDIVGDNFQWQKFSDDGYQGRPPDGNEEVLDSCYAFISNTPVSVQLIQKDEIYKLKVNYRLDFNVNNDASKIIKT